MATSFRILREKGKKYRILDKEAFLNIALEKGYDMGLIQDFIADDMQNLLSIKENLNRLKKYKKRR